MITSGGVNGEKPQYTTDVSITLSVTDELSGMIHQYFPPTFEKTEYRISGREWLLYNAPIVLSAVELHKLEYRSADVVGNLEEIQSVDVSIVAPTPTPKHYIQGSEQYI